MQLMIGCSLLALIILISAVGPEMTGYSYDQTDLESKNLAPSMLHWFGTDDLGRDVFTRCWFGARISLLVGVAAALIDMIIGIIWGSLAAYLGGVYEETMMRLVDILYSLPYLLIVILFMVALEPGLISILLSMTFLGWMTMARIVRGQVLQIMQKEYVLAARAFGAGYFYILRKHILPNIWGPILVTLAYTIPSAIFTEAFLSFLGLGIQAPIASLGTMASEGLPALPYYPWRLMYPALLISVIILAFNLIGEALREAYDVEQTAHYQLA